MSKLSGRVRKLEGAQGQATAVWALVPGSWPQAKQESVAQRLARQNGFEPPFEFTLLQGKRDEPELLYAGRTLDPAEIWAAIRKEELRLDSESRFEARDWK